MGYHKYIPKTLKDSEIVKYWSLERQFMNKLMKNERLYIEDLHIMSCLYIECQRRLRPINRKELLAAFPIMSFKLVKTLDRLEKSGLIQNDLIRRGRRGESFKLSLTLSGEQLLIKYDRSLRKMANTTKRYMANEE